MRRVALALAAAALAAGCGGGDGGELRVAAAASLKRPLTAYGERFGDVRLSFASSGQLAAQIRGGARPDAFVSADASIPQGLFEEGLVEKPAPVAANRLVIAVPADAPEVGSLEDLGRPGIRIAIATSTAPVGGYTEELLDRLDPALASRIRRNARSSEPDVAGVVGKLVQGVVDAGFVYATDVQASGDRLRAIELPRRLRPPVVYAAAVVEGAREPERARDFVRGLLSGDGARLLREAGFEPPPPPGL